MGVGKSTLGTTFSMRNNIDYVDSDEDIERIFGSTGGEIAEKCGIGVLHEIEAAVLIGALAPKKKSVITAAASVIENGIACHALKRRATVVWLRGDIDETLRRQRLGTHRRIMARDELVALEKKRHPMFKEVADLELDAQQSPIELTKAIEAFLGLRNNESN